MKAIKDIRFEDWGQFLDQSDGGKIGVNTEGEILLDEIGSGFNGAIVSPENFESFQIINSDDSFELTLNFSGLSYSLGRVENAEIVREWIERVEYRISKARLGK